LPFGNTRRRADLRRESHPGPGLHWHTAGWHGVGFVSAGLALVPVPAEACAGFFCGRSAPTPVDPVAERILFEIGEDRVTMTTQITYDGDAAHFAWVLPLGELPVAGSLERFG
jgi:hypothetical protein